MSFRIGIRELRQQASAVLKRVGAGETVEVTDHGHPIARIVPYRADPLEQLTAEGRITEARGDILETMGTLGQPRPLVKGSQLPSEALAEMRADER